MLVDVFGGLLSLGIDRRCWGGFSGRGIWFWVVRVVFKCVGEFLRRGYFGCFLCFLVKLLLIFFKSIRGLFVFYLNINLFNV